MISETLRKIRRGVVVFSMAAVPLAFNTDTFDVFNLTKFTLVIVLTIVALGLWIFESVQRKRLLFPRTGIELPMLALLVATGLSTLASFAKVVSILGFYKSYDGLISIAAFTVFGLLAAEVLDSKSHLRACLYALAFGGGIPSAVYGVLQYVTFATEGRIRLDWELWGPASFKTSSIFSTYGNPNHFAAFLAIALPVAVVLAVTSTEAPVKWLGWGFTVLATLEILQAQSRGAWAAYAAVAVVLALAFLPELKKRPRLVAGIAASWVGLFAFAAVALRSRTNLLTRLASMVAVNDTSSRQRVLLWRAGIEAALDKPLFGWGLDTFRTVFLRYQGMEFFKRYGPNQIANGPHNVFISWFYSAGILGLGAFLWMNWAVFSRVLRYCRASRQAESAAELAPRRYGIPSSVFREWRLLLGGIGAAVASYLVSNSFNVNQIGITFLFYMLAAFACKGAVLLRDELRTAESALRLEPGSLVPEEKSFVSFIVSTVTVRTRASGDVNRTEPSEEGRLSERASATASKGAENAEERGIGRDSRSPVQAASKNAARPLGKSRKGASKSTRASAERVTAGTAPKDRNSRGPKSIRKNTAPPRSKRRRTKQAERLSAIAVVVTVLYVLASIPVLVQALRPYRADHIYRKYQSDAETAKRMLEASSQDPNALEMASVYVQRAATQIEDAIRRNPWESRYYYDLYEVGIMEAMVARSRNQAQAQYDALQKALSALERAARLSPQEERFYYKAGELLSAWGGAHSVPMAVLEPDPQKLPDAVHYLRLAREYNPWDLEVDKVLVYVAQSLDDVELAFEATCHGWWLGEGNSAAATALWIAREGYVDEGVRLLRKYLSTYDYHGVVANALGEVTATVRPSSDQSPTPAQGGTENSSPTKRLELPDCLRQILQA